MLIIRRISEDFLFFLALPNHTTGEEILKVTEEHFNKHNLEWHNFCDLQGP